MHVHVKIGCSCSKHLYTILASVHIETYPRFKDLVMAFFKIISSGHTFICKNIIIIIPIMLLA